MPDAAPAQASLRLFFVLDPRTLTSLGYPDETVKTISLARTGGKVFAVNSHNTGANSLVGTSVEMSVWQGTAPLAEYGDPPCPNAKKLSSWQAPCQNNARFVVVPLKLTWAGHFNIYMHNGKQEWLGRLRVTE